MKKLSFKQELKKINFIIFILPFSIVFILSLLFFLYPTKTNEMLASFSDVFKDKLKFFFVLVNLIAFILAIYLSFSKYGNVVLGDKKDKPKFSFWAWGSMMFCCGLSGSLIYYSFTEWISYINEPYIKSLGNPYDFANVHSVYFWANYWMYLVLAVCFGFMMFVRKRKRQKFSEGLRALCGNKVDGIFGSIVDVFAVLVTFSAVGCSLFLDVPLIGSLINKVFNIPNTNLTSIAITIFICIVYCTSVLNGLKGIDRLSRTCVYLFLFIVGYIFFTSNNMIYIIENSIEQVGLLVSNIPRLFTYVDAKGTYDFSKNYTSFYLAYWMTWTITVPFFIAVISKGMTIKQVILGGLCFAVPGGVISFLIIPNYSIGLQQKGIVDILGMYNSGMGFYEIITEVLSRMPLYPLPLIITMISLVLFCATSYDSISLTCSYYAYKNIDSNQMPHKYVRLFFAISLILLPIGMLFSKSSYENFTNIAVLFGFPGAILFILTVISFFIDINKYMSNK